MRRAISGSAGTVSRLAMVASFAFSLACASSDRQVGSTAAAPTSRTALTPPATAAGYPARVVLISVTGMTPAAYLASAGETPAMPTVAALGRAGAAADAMTTVTPAARYPAHATLVTGQPPSVHGIVADRQLGERGVRRTPFWHASLLKTPPIWGIAAREKLMVASLGWPTTVGASISALIPDIVPVNRGETWFGAVAAASTPALIDRIEASERGDPALEYEGAARDALLTRIACSLLAAEQPPDLTLLMLSQAAPALTAYGPGSEAARASLARADADVRRVIDCVESRDRGGEAAIVIVGDRGLLPVHTLVAPNAVLAEAGLIVPNARALGTVQSWSALARSNGGTAFVYAADAEAAVIARRALSGESLRSRSFRVVGAEEMLAGGADPEAWFGLAAEPGFAFGNQIVLPVLQPEARRGVGGYLSGRAGTEAGFVAWGRGIRPGVRVPLLRQADVAPTVARLLGIELGDVDGRALIGILSLPATKAAVPTSNTAEAR